MPGAPGARPRAGCPRSRGRSARSAALTRTLPRDERRARTRRMARGCIALLDVVLRRIIPRAAPGKRYNNRWRPCRSSASFVNNAQKNRVNFMQQTTDLELRGRAHVGCARNTRLAATPASDAQRLAGTPTRASRRATVFPRAKSVMMKTAYLDAFHPVRVHDNKCRSNAAIGMTHGYPTGHFFRVRNCTSYQPLSVNRFEGKKPRFSDTFVAWWKLWLVFL